MKITQQQKFQPITLVLETELEAEVLKSLAGIVNSRDEDIGAVIDSIYDRLEDLGISPESPFQSGVPVIATINSDDLMAKIVSQRGADYVG